MVSEEPIVTETPTINPEPTSDIGDAIETEVPNTPTPIVSPVEPIVTDTPNVTDEPIVEPTPEPIKEVEYNYVFIFEIIN